MTPKRKPTKPRTKAVKAIYGVMESNGELMRFYRSGVPVLSGSKKSAAHYCGCFGRKIVRVLISIAPSKGKRR